MTLARDVFTSLSDHLRPLLAYHLLFTLFASALLLPTLGWLLAIWLEQVGRPLVTTADAVELLLSPLGFTWVFAFAAGLLTLLYLQQAGMMLVAVERQGSHARQALVALWQSLHRLPALATLACLQVAVHLSGVAILLACAHLVHDSLLSGLDAYYVRHVRPPAFWLYLSTLLPMVGLWLALAGRLYIRWWLALPSLVLEGLKPFAALRRSHALTVKRQGGLALVIFSMLTILLALPSAVSLVFSAWVGPLIANLPDISAVVIPTMLAVVTSATLLTLGVAFAIIVVNALLATCLYLRRAHRLPRPAPPPADAHPGRWAWGIEVGIVLFALSQAWMMVERQDIREQVHVIAHRGASMVAPENSMSAIRRAMDDGADVIEIDVRLAGDGTVVLSHDATLLRLAGDDRRIGELDWSELARLDIGASFAHAFAGEPLARLDRVLEEVRGRARLLIELKPERGQEEALIEAVLGDLQRERQQRLACRHDATDKLDRLVCGDPQLLQTSWLASLSYRQVQRINQLAPDARSLLLAEWALPGSLPYRHFNGLGLRHTQIDDDQLRRAHVSDKPLYAWTVNDPARMARLIDLGVDGIITDRPDLLTALLRERQAMSDAELMLTKLRHWLES
ncbi:glycerophosphoryl diester phosphodiesterase membrane domain-containing protein [Halomonas sp. DP5Y7-2]|uniref:glycerophosphodiester phosphodiesterase family protein n=1 Tax=Halomonas sp. DP5Y7-2 TaxID=2859076 RepID=UPI001C99FE73|nr:glycerophosphodiester phosphodiesterase family protein [Halomonas sp. DP5Y7-2]MBY5986203.1 glycerophosphoryl diester phosphodiesterase membrane domain-containing protein [Halomonas sp. DP5Y7-2]